MYAERCGHVCYDMQLGSAASFRAESGGLDFSTIFVTESRYTFGIYRVIHEDVIYRGTDLSKTILSKAKIHEKIYYAKLRLFKY